MPISNLSSQVIIIVCREGAEAIRESLFMSFVQSRAVLRAHATAVILNSPVADRVYDQFCTSLVRVLILLLIFILHVTYPSYFL